MYDTIRANLHFNKFAVGGAALCRVQVPDRGEATGVLTTMDYFVHVLSSGKP
jgi:hypothetical protein